MRVTGIRSAPGRQHQRQSYDVQEAREKAEAEARLRAEEEAAAAAAAVPSEDSDSVGWDEMDEDSLKLPGQEEASSKSPETIPQQNGEVRPPYWLSCSHVYIC